MAKLKSFAAMTSINGSEVKLNVWIVIVGVFSLCKATRLDIVSCPPAHLV